MDISINDPTVYVIYSIYSNPVFPYFVTLNCMKKPTFPFNISKSTYISHYFIFFEIGYLNYQH